MSFDLLLKPSCSGCGSTTDLYGSNCKHMTLCLNCGKTMAENRGKCFDCGTTVSRLIREYNVRASTSSDKNYFIGRFVTGLPSFSKKKNAENKWSLHKEGILGRQITDALREKFKNKPWLLEDETGQSQYQGHLEGSQSATYYLLMMTGKEFVAIPAGSWYNFNKVAHYKQLTLEEAEEKMKNRRKTADGYERWMMKAANNGAAAFGEVEKVDDKEGVSAGGRGGRRKASGDDDEGNVSDRGEEDEEEEAGRKSRLGLNKQGGDDDEEGPRGGDLDMDDDDIEKGDDWEHEEIFTDDDEAVAIDPEEREDLAPEVPAPPEIKQDEDDEDEENEEGGLSKSGKELKKLLGKANGLNESDVEDDDDDEDMDDDISPVLAPKQKDVVPKEEAADISPAKPTPSGSAKGTPSTSKSAKGKRKLNGEDAKSSNGAPVKKVKTENQEVKPAVKEESSPATKGTATPKVTPPSSKTGSTSGSTGPVTEEEIRAVLLQNGPVTTQDLVARFKSRLRTPEDKKAFADILRRISKIQKTSGSNYVVLRDK
ncbi:transcription initiation factor IIF subunit alpha isoform X1 [Populus trichocarpa]|uniref:transcription initiation factor IIF subunit alpha isoform X1 n=1 Tax=Populus trichocarpa TaxID=3694 RepID=UPI000CCD41FD|nr:transcription initiation factor IIF subunit alpha isoform X1 [Populus trichocarpa]XP_052303968.1 transcription initiation factor IIF subunit alpha isoform X1 [Populus trichocarpa]|eukprot:XP_024443955.1 transcription initiation factor IIF subunit alpha isoform X1 [Populus trichocarpa]